MFLELNKVAIVILSQKEGYNAAQAHYLRKTIFEQADALEGVRLSATPFFYMYFYDVFNVTLATHR